MAISTMMSAATRRLSGKSRSVLLPAAGDDRETEIHESVDALRKQIERRYNGAESTDRSFATEKHGIDS